MSLLFLSPLKKMGCVCPGLFLSRRGTVREEVGRTDEAKGMAVYCHPVYLTYMQSTS